MNDTDDRLEADVENVSRIGFIPVLLEAVCKITGMGFAAVARVTHGRWMACSVRDEIKFGLQPGGELDVETTICHEIRQHGDAVVIDHVSRDLHYSKHHTPTMYGFESYISVPIYRQDGSFFGTLCAIDPKAAVLNTPRIIEMFRAFAILISCCLDAHGKMPADELAGLEARITDSLHALLAASENAPHSRESLAEKMEQSSRSVRELINDFQQMAMA